MISKIPFSNHWYVSITLGLILHLATTVVMQDCCVSGSGVNKHIEGSKLVCGGLVFSCTSMVLGFSLTGDYQDFSSQSRVCGHEGQV
jgi:hypothetical protein